VFIVYIKEGRESKKGRNNERERASSHGLHLKNDLSAQTPSGLDAAKTQLSDDKIGAEK
jgi:hypothetical protein